MLGTFPHTTAYSFKMMTIITFLILIFSAHVRPEDGITEITASGDGDSLISMTASVPMIDENGEISSVPSVESISVETGTGSENTTASLITDSTAEETTTVMPVTDTTEISTTAAPTSTTTESTTTTTTSVPTTTTTVTTTSTAVPTTTIKTTTRKVTTTTVKPTSKAEPKVTTERIPQAPTVGTTYNPDTEGKSCTFLDTNLICSEEVTCYGEGEIDCSDEADVIPEADKLHLSSISEDYSDFDSTEATIGTFPPNLVGVVTPKTRFPFLFNMGSLGTTQPDMDVLSETTQQETTATETTLLMEETSVLNEKLLNEERDVIAEDAVVMDAKLSDSHETTSEAFNVPSSTAPPVFSSSEETMNKLSSEISADVTRTQAITTVEYVTSGTLPMTVLPLEDVSAAVMEDSSSQPIVVRRKREDKILSSGSQSSSSSMSASFHVAALESSKQKIRIKTCKLTGNLVCTPAPTTSMCKGKTYCQVVSGTAETSEKSTSAKGVENWAIAVIAICAIAAALTVSLLVYLVVTSWKKLKVQPQNGVTTLTYVNSTPP